jgi:hypothetical protein
MVATTVVTNPRSSTGKGTSIALSQAIARNFTGISIKLAIFKAAIPANSRLSK